MMSRLFGLMPLWVKIAIVTSLLSATLGGLIYYVDDLCNSEKRSLSVKIGTLNKEIKRKNVTIKNKIYAIKRMRGEVKRVRDKSQNDLLRVRIECAKMKRRHYEVPIVDANSSIWF